MKKDLNKEVVLTMMGQIMSDYRKPKELESVKVVLDENTVLNDPEAIYNIEGTVTKATKIEAKTAILNECVMESAPLNIKAVETVMINNATLTGTIDKSVTNAAVTINADERVVIRDCELNPSVAYNGIEIGLNGGLAKSVIIESVDFAGTFSNNAINIFAMAENGVVTIKNCHFQSVSNALRVSNATNVPFTINLVDCTIDKWDTNPTWRGAVIFQDYTSGSAEAANEANQFAKIKLNITNLTQPDGTVLACDNLAEICGTANDKQVIYLWDNYRNTVVYGDMYPQITIK